MLADLTGGQLTVDEIADALGTHRGNYFKIVKAGIPADRLVAAAHNLGINPIELLVRYSPDITEEDAVEFIARKFIEANPPKQPKRQPRTDLPQH